MASNGVPVSAPVTRPAVGSPSGASTEIYKPNGKPLPASGGDLPPAATSTAASAAAPVPAKATDPDAAAQKDAELRALIARLNKSLNDSGQPNRFQVDSTSGGKLIQEINPASGAVIGEYSAAEFPVLARGLGVSGVSGLVLDQRA